jgi:uncharacterized protein
MSTAISYSETIVPRENLDFGLDASIPQYWYRGDAYKSRYVDAVQLSFPDGERYFITCVRAFRDQITDPALQVAVRDFTRQEGQHGMVHTRYNKLLETQGLPVDALLDQIKALIARRMRIYSPQFNLALTAAAEHFTAMLAEAFFAKAATTEGMNSSMRAMLAWHAIEEMEHKSVAYDVMQKVAGVGYRLRVLAMLFAIKEFLAFTYRVSSKFLEADGYNKRQRFWMHVKHLGWLHGPRKGIYGSLTGRLLVYFKPGFHPTQEPTMHNYKNWLEAYERTGDPGIACDAMCAAAYR